MNPALRPDAIDPRLVFRVYAWVAIVYGSTMYAWGTLILPDVHLIPVQWGSAALLRLAGAAIVAAGVCATAFARMGDPVSRHTGLFWFAAAHLVFGVLALLQWQAILSVVLPPVVGWAPLLVGSVLFYLAYTGPGEPTEAPFDRAISILRSRRGADLAGEPADVHFAIRNKPGLSQLRSQYVAQLRVAARQEERARLARDLHDAVKQQLFVVQTAAATAEARFDTDADGARAAVEQVRSAAREAMTEMEAMIDQLQAAPLENSGLVEAIKRQAEALAFRTGADVKVEIGTLPPSSALAPGAREAIYRVAQEALSNVGRHARARAVHVSMGLESGQFVLALHDDGSGFELEARPRGMGMSNMAARAAEVGGSLDVTSARGRGTTVRFALPYDPPSARDYRRRALGWSVVLILVIGPALAGGIGALSDRPILLAVATIAAIAVVRSLVAGRRITRTHGA
jgi:signal transduction histidine kinase